MKSPKPLFALALAACLTLSGCAAPSSEAAPGQPAAAWPGSDTPITHVAYVDSFSEYAASPDGLYTVSQVRLGGQNLFYVDASSQQETYLCAVPNCTHDSESCTSWLPLDGGYGSGLFFANGHLYAVQNSTTQSHGPRILQLDPDGANRKTVLELQDGELFFGSVFGYGSSFLMEITGVDENGSSRSRLERIDPATGAREVVLEYPEQERQVFQLMGAAGTRLVYLCIDYEQRQYFTVDLSSPGASLEHWQDNLLGPAHDNVTTYCTIQGDYFCTYDANTNRLGYQNLLTGETREFDAPALAEGERLFGLVHFFDGRFALTLDDAQNNVAWALLDTESGQLTGMRYRPTQENAHMIVADLGDQLICRVRDGEMPLKGQEQENLVGELGYYSVYTVLTKEEFLQGADGEEIPFPGA